MNGMFNIRLFKTSIIQVILFHLHLNVTVTEMCLFNILLSTVGGPNSFMIVKKILNIWQTTVFISNFVL